MNVPNLRSPNVKVNGLCYFGRMLDKIRLYAKGELPADYHPNLGGGFDERCCSFLWIEYPALVAEVKNGNGSDEEVLDWVYQQGRKPNDEDMEIWNEFMRKRGWNDEASERLQMRIREVGTTRTDIHTFFDFIDLDEGRK